MAIATGGVVVATSDLAFFDNISCAVAGFTRGQGQNSTPRRIEGAGPDLGSPDHIGDAAVVLIDDRWPEGSGLQSLAKSTSLQEISDRFSSQGEALPAVRLIRAAQGRDPRSAGRPRPLVIICADSPTLAFAQVAMANNVDWIWSRHDDFDKLESVIVRLIELKSRIDVGQRSKPAIIIVENAFPVIKALETDLGNDFNLSIVNEDLKPASEFSVTVKEAMAHFAENGPFDGAIVDLSLSDEEEMIARKEVGSEQSSLDGFLSGSIDITEYFSGVRVVKDILDRDNDIVMIVLSNYLKDTATLARINMSLGEISRNISFFFKDTDGYRQLRELLEFKLLGGRS